MAKFIVTSGSHFQPFTYDELVKPLLQMQEAHNAAQEQYDTLGMETAALANYISNNPGDSDAKRMYDEYNTLLSNLQQDLWENGYTPRTKRNLHDARIRYSSDIARIAKAVEARQAAGKAYNDMRLAHPDLVMGRNPGLDGLNQYLANDRYGQDYYTYSGDSFMKEVGTDAEARKQEVLNDPKYIDNPNKRLRDYVLRIINYGYTSGEVSNAAKLAWAALQTGNREPLNDSRLPLAEKILAEVLVSHMDSTGANASNLSPSEYLRLFNYGVAGLSQSIGTKQFHDINTAKGVSGSGGGGGNNGGGPVDSILTPTYDITGLITEKYGPDYLDIANGAAGDAYQSHDGNGKVLLHRYGGPLIRKYDLGGDIGNTYSEQEFIDAIETPTEEPSQQQPPMQQAEAPGTLVDDDPWAFAEYVYNPEARKKARSIFGGLDVALAAENFFGTTASKQTGYIMKDDGTKVNVNTDTLSNRDADRLGLPRGSVAIMSGGKLLDQATKTYNKYVQDYNDWVNERISSNPEHDFDGRRGIFGLGKKPAEAITPKAEAEYRKKFNIPSTVDSSDIGAIVKTKGKLYSGVDASVADPHRGNETAREDFTNNVVSTFTQNNAYGVIGKGSPYAIYKVGKGGLVTDKENAITDLAEVFGKGKEKVIDPSVTNNIFINPLDLAEGAGDGDPRIRFTTNLSSSDVYSASAKLFGARTYNMLKDSIFPAQYNWGKNNCEYFGLQAPKGADGRKSWSLSDAVNFILRPLTKPEEVMSMTDEQSNAWTRVAFSLLNDRSLPMWSGGIRGAYTYNQDGDIQLVSAKDVVRNQKMQEQIYESVVDYINTLMSVVRDRQEITGVPKSASDTSGATPYIPNPSLNKKKKK